jgi:hypothetical protein
MGGQMNERDLNALVKNYLAFPFRISYMGKGVRYECWYHPQAGDRRECTVASVVNGARRGGIEARVHINE